MRTVVTLLSAVALAAALASPSAAQTPVAPSNGEPIEESDVVLRWTLEPGWQTRCIEWSARPETSFDGGPFLDRDGGTCELGPRDVAYLLEGLGVRRYYWHVQVGREVCDSGEFDCRAEQLWGPTAYFDSVVPPRDTSDDPGLPGYRFCGWKDFGSGRWSLAQPDPGAFMRAFASGMSCRTARRHVSRTRFTQRPPYRPYRRGYRCVKLDSGIEYVDVRCTKRGSRGRVKFRYQTGA